MNPRTLRAMPKSIARLSLLAALALVAAGACSPPAVTPIPGPTCTPPSATNAPGVGVGATAAPSGSAGAGGSSAAPTVAPSVEPLPTLPSANPNATPIANASSSGIIVYANGDLGNGPAQLHVVWPDGSHQGDLTTQVIGGFSVSPDGRTVEFEGVAGPYLVNTDGTHERPLPVGGLNVDSFRWSPDSRWLAFHGWSPTDPTIEGIYEVDPSGCQPVKIDVAGAEHDVPIEVGPDGSILAYVSTDETANQQIELGVIYLDRPSDGKRIRISPPGGLSNVENNTGSPAAWAPDGKHIAFTSAAATGATWSATLNALWIVDPDGTNAKELITDGIVGGIAWSPASQWIATGRFGPGGAPEAYVVNLDGSKASWLTSFEAPGGCCPVWSPDGKSLLIWPGGIIIPFEGSGASSVQPLKGVPTYAYAWVKPKG